MKVLVFVEHDIIIRHFLHSRVFDEVVRRHDVVFVFPEPGHKRVKGDIGVIDFSGARVRHLTVSSARLRRWQHLFLADILRYRPGAHFAAIRRFYRHAVGFRPAMLLTLLSLPGLLPMFGLWSRRQIAATPYVELEALLAEEKPDVLVHPSILSGVFINDLVDASNTSGIPLIVIMNSWDNPSTKRAVTGQPDWLLVWGPQTQEHAVRYIGIPAERAICFGAAQFDLYRNPPRIDRDEFCRRHELEPGRRLLLYAGSSKGTDEFAHLRMLDEAIERGDLADAAVVYRPHPWGEGGKGGARILRHPWRHVRIEQTMREYLELVEAGGAGITTPDYRNTHDLLSAVDAVVSPLSTILLEGALHGKPVLCFLPDTEKDTSHYSFALPLVHFDDLFSEPTFFVARGDAALLPMVKTLLGRVGDAAFAASLREACARFVSPFDRPYGERLVEFLERVVVARTGGAISV